MINLELERKKLEMVKVAAAKEEMKFRIMERESEIQRLQENIENQDKRLKELKDEIQSMEGLNG